MRMTERPALGSPGLAWLWDGLIRTSLCGVVAFLVPLVAPD